MPVDQCCVCNDPLDHQYAGFCECCKGAFCWTHCGDWGVLGHMCNNCGDLDNQTKET